MAIKILSWNVNGIRACGTKTLFEFLDHEVPDIAGFQEVKAMPEQCLDLSERLSGFRQVWHPAERPGYSGVMNLFRFTPVGVTLGCGLKKFDREGRVLISDLGDFFYLNMYFPNGAASEDRHYFKMDFLKEALGFFKSLDKIKPLVLAGDFNIAHKAIDIHDPIRLDGTSGFMPEERAWMDELAREGFIDAFRHLNPDAKDQYSWWSYRQLSRQRNKGWRIDYFFVSDRIKNRIRSMKMHTEIGGSDHCPLTLVLDF